MADKKSETTTTNPFVFVVGCPRSGTTLLQRMLDNHPQLAVANDTHFITRAAKKILRNNPRPPLTNGLLEAVISYRRFYRMGLEDVEVRNAAQDCAGYAEFVSRLYSLRGHKKRKPLSGEKTPDYCRKIPQLHRLFPTARFIHIIRDGRNTALSTLNWATASKGPGRWSLWSEDPLGTCALWWQWQAGTGQRDGENLGSKFYLQVEYEKLVAKPQQTLQSLASFLDISYCEEMANYHIGKTKSASGLSAKSAWLPPVKNLRDWREDMSAEDIGVFEGIAGELLRENGYSCRDKPPETAVASRIQRCLAWWESEGKLAKPYSIGLT